MADDHQRILDQRKLGDLIAAHLSFNERDVQLIVQQTVFQAARVFDDECALDIGMVFMQALADGRKHGIGDGKRAADSQLA